MTEEKLFQYEVTCAGGLEETLIDEIRAVFGKRVRSLREERGEVGRVFFHYEGSPRRLFELECAAAIMVVVCQMHDVTVGAPGLERIGQRLRKLPLQAMSRLAQLGDRAADLSGYQLRVQQRGSHRFDAAQTEDVARVALAEQGMRPSSRGLDLELRVQKRRAQLKLILRHATPAGAVEQTGPPAAMVAAIVRMLGLDETDDLLLVHASDEAAAAARRVSDAHVVRLRRSRSPSSEAGGSHSCGVVGADHQLPLQAGSMTAAILVLGDDEAVLPGDVFARLSQAVGTVAEEGVIAALVPSAEAFAARLGHFGLPVEIIGAIPVHVRRRRWALFLLSRLDLIQLA